MAAYNEYAKALFLATEEDGLTEEILSDMKLLSSIFRENQSYINLLDTPAISKPERLKMIDEALSDVSEYLRNLIKILSERNSVYSYFEIEKGFIALYNESRGIELVEAVTAIPMSDGQIEKMAKKLADMTGKKIIIKNTVDENILGGVKLRYSGIQLDGSLKTRLCAFEKSLKNTVI